jgi:hypothetical protein
MSSTGKMALFFIGATMFNIALMVALIAVFVIAIGFILGGSRSPILFQVLLFAGFIASIVLTFLIYGKVMKWVTVKFNLEKNLPQLFRKKR